MDTVIFGNDLTVLDARDDVPDIDPGYSRRDAEKIDFVVVHHDATPFDTVRQDDELQRILTAYAYHTQTHGWPGIGYHLYLFPSGRVYYVGDWATNRYHTAGPDDPNTPEVISRYNEHGLSIVVAGNFDDKPPTPATLLMLKHTIANAQFLFSRTMPAYPHHALTPTHCPGLTWPDWAALITP